MVKNQNAKKLNPTLDLAQTADVVKKVHKPGKKALTKPRDPKRTGVSLFYLEGFSRQV